MTTRNRLKPYHLTGNLGNNQHHGHMRFKKKKRDRVYQPTIGEDIELKVAQDHTVKTSPHENRKRRTLIMTKTDGQTWGFTLQSYGIQRKDMSDEVDTLTYVDYVEYGSPAYIAGMQTGDVILSINGVSMETLDHTSLIQFIRSCPDSVRVVVLFEDCVRKVEHHLKLRKLKKLLAAKMFELKSLENIEKDILDGRSDRLSLHSSSRVSLAEDSYSLVPDDVFPETPRMSTGFLYGSLPRNFHVRALRAGSPVPDDTVSHGSVARVSTYSEEEADNQTPGISLNPRLDSRYTSLPPDVRSRSGRSDRQVGNSKFYGEWLSENDNMGRHFSSTTSCNITRDSGVYQTWTSGMVKNKNHSSRGSTRSIGNSLFYLESAENESETDEIDDNGPLSDDANTSSSTLEYQASNSSLDMIDSVTVRNVDKMIDKSGSFERNSSDGESGHLKSDVRKRSSHSCRKNNKTVLPSDNKSQPIENNSVISSISHNTNNNTEARHNNNGQIVQQYDDTLIMSKSDLVSPGRSINASFTSLPDLHSPVRPASLPDIQTLGQKKIEGHTISSCYREPGIDSPVFTDGNQDNVGTFGSDWMISGSSDMITPTPELFVTSTPFGNKVSKDETVKTPKMRKNTASTGTMEDSKAKKWWMFKKRASSPEISRSMGNLAVSSSLEEPKKDNPTSVNKPFRFPSFKLSRSKIRNSLSRLRNRSSSYFVSGEETVTDDSSANQSRASFEIASPNDSCASLVSVLDGSDDDKSAFTGIEAYATLPRRAPKIRNCDKKDTTKFSNNEQNLGTNNNNIGENMSSVETSGVTMNDDKNYGFSSLDKMGLNKSDINLCDKSSPGKISTPTDEIESSRGSPLLDSSYHDDSPQMDVEPMTLTQTSGGFFDEVMDAISNSSVIDAASDNTEQFIDNTGYASDNKRYTSDNTGYASDNKRYTSDNTGYRSNKDNKTSRHENKNDKVSELDIENGEFSNVLNMFENINNETSCNDGENDDTIKVYKDKKDVEDSKEVGRSTRHRTSPEKPQTVSDTGSLKQGEPSFLGVKPSSRIKKGKASSYTSQETESLNRENVFNEPIASSPVSLDVDFSAICIMDGESEKDLLKMECVSRKKSSKKNTEPSFSDSEGIAKSEQLQLSKLKSKNTLETESNSKKSSILSSSAMLGSSVTVDDDNTEYSAKSRSGNAELSSQNSIDNKETGLKMKPKNSPNLSSRDIKSSKLRGGSPQLKHSRNVPHDSVSLPAKVYAKERFVNEISWVSSHLKPVYSEPGSRKDGATAFNFDRKSVLDYCYNGVTDDDMNEVAKDCSDSNHSNSAKEPFPGNSNDNSVLNSNMTESSTRKVPSQLVSSKSGSVKEHKIAKRNRQLKLNVNSCSSLEERSHSGGSKDNVSNSADNAAITSEEKHSKEKESRRPGWKSPLTQRQLQKLALSTTANQDDPIENDDATASVSSKIKFFSRNMMTTETGSECDGTSEFAESSTAENSGKKLAQLNLTSVSQTGSPKRFVIQKRKLSKFKVSEQELANEFNELCVQNVEDQIVRYPGSGGSHGYKRRFYTYEEVPAIKHELSLVNSNEDQTWL